MPSREQLIEVIKFQTDIAHLGLDLGGVMALVVDRLPLLVGADGAALELVEADEMVYQAASGIAREQVGLRIKRASSLSGLCVATGQVQACADSETDPRVDQVACRRIGLRSMLVAPLKHGGDTVGVLKVMSATPDHFKQNVFELLTLLSDMVGAAMYFATRYGRDELFFLATHDSLTGVPNRALFMDRLRAALRNSARDQRPVAVLMVDLDGLKQVNDFHGHHAGDAVIKEFSRRLQATVRESDTVARVGGDEFAVVLTPVEAAHGVEVLVRRLRTAIAASFELDGQSFPLQASIGISQFPDDAQDIAPLLKLADARMYVEKRAKHD